MAFKASPFVVVLLLGATFITNEAISLGIEKIMKMETEKIKKMETESMSLSLMNAEASAKAMESVFFRSDDVHTNAMKKTMKEMSNDEALKVFHKLNHTDPVLIQLADKAMKQGQAGLRGLLNKRQSQFADPTSGGKVTQKQSDKTNSGVDSIRLMMNEMIEESMTKYDIEIDRCTSFYRSQCAQMTVARGKIAGANARSANARALMSDAQSCINKCEEDIPELKQELKDFKKKCSINKAKLQARQKLLEADLSTMGTILKLVDESCQSFIQTDSQTAMVQGGDQNGHVEMCVDPCTGEHFLKVMHKEHRLKSSVGVKLLGEAVSDVMSGYGSPSFLQLNMSVGHVTDTDPGKKNVATLTTPPPATKVPQNPCTDPFGGGPSPTKKRGAKCVMRGDCTPMKERFLQVRASMEEEVDVIKQAIEDLTEHCDTTQTRLTRSIKTQEALEDKCQTNLAQAQEKQNDAAKEADDTAAEHHDLHEDLDKTMKTCNNNYIGFEGEMCALKKIRGEVFKLKASGQTAFFQDCSVGPWIAEPCSVPCGGGTQSLVRKVVNTPNLGAKCLPLTAVRNCNMFPCPVDCKKDVWELWSACSADCGGGVQQRVRELLVQPKFGGAPCGPMEQSRRCNEMACDQNCKMTEWTTWSDCSKACDGGTSKRERFVLTPATGTGTCADPWSPERLQYKGCNRDPCQLSTGQDTMKCKAKLDVVLLIDGSGSLGQTGWDAELLAADTFISAFEGQNTEIQLSAILYSGPTTWGQVFTCFKSSAPTNLVDNCKIKIVEHMTSDIAKVKKAVSELKWPGGSTLTSMALVTAGTELDQGRADAKSVVVCITDGRPLGYRKTWFAARALRKKARLMWVPVTRYAPLRFIKSWATRRWQENIVQVKSFADLKDTKKEITNHLIADLCPKEGLGS